MNELCYWIEELDSGMLGMVLEPPEIDRETRRQIVDIKRMHDTDKMTFRQIAAEIEPATSIGKRRTKPIRMRKPKYSSRYFRSRSAGMSG